MFCWRLVDVCERETTSVQILIRHFEGFSNVNGLVANISKCKVYFGGVNCSTQHEILQLIGFARVRLPFKYLGIPPDRRKLYVATCLSLIEKITCRLEHWSS